MIEKGKRRTRSRTDCQRKGVGQGDTEREKGDREAG